MANNNSQLAEMAPVEVPAFRRKVIQVRTPKKPRPFKHFLGVLKLFFKIEFWFLMCCGYLMGRAAVLQLLYPLGQAFLCSLLLSRVKRIYAFSATLLILAGHYQAYGTALLAEQAVALAYIFWFFRPSGGRPKAWHHCTYLYAILLLVRAAALSVFRLSWHSMALVGIETIMAYLLTLIYTRGIGAVMRIEESTVQNLKQDELFALLFLIICVLSGAVGLSAYGFSIQSFLAAFTIMLCSFVAGGGAGAATGVSIAMIWGLSGELSLSVNQWSLYGFSGLLGGVFREKGKGGTVLGYLLGTFILVSQMKGIERLGFFLLENLSAVSVFSLLPAGLLRRLARQVPGTYENIQETEQQQKKLKNMVAKRLSELAQIFTRLGQSFNVENEDPPQPLDNNICDNIHKIIQKSCQQCQSYATCWGDYFYQSYREVLDLIAVAEQHGDLQASDLKGRLGKHCHQQSRLTGAISGLLQTQWEHHLWRQKILESRKLVSGQLSGVVQLMQSLAAEIRLDVEYHHELEQSIKHGLAAQGIECLDVSVYFSAERQNLIELELPCCGGAEKCSTSAVPAVCKLVDRKFSICQKKCGHLLNSGSCHLWLNTSPKFRVDYHTAKAAKSGNALSGDSHSLIMLKEGKCAVTLSDGMGTGPKAALESSTAVNLMEQLLESGMDYKFAVKMVNNILLLRSTEEIFATVDLALIDLFQAEMEMLKIGAASSYVKRQREVIRIESDSLPAGILSAVDIEPQKVALKDGDILVMITDGVLDAVTEFPAPEDWVMKLLKRIDIGEPETLAAFILAMAKEHYGGEIRDDLTVIVLKIQEVFSGKGG